MRFAHVTLCTEDLEGMAGFWRRYFGATIGEPRHSEHQQGLVSRLAALPAGPHRTDDHAFVARLDTARRVRWDRVAVSVGSEAAVDALAGRLKRDRFEVAPPRRTGCGQYETMVRAPGGVQIAITT